jgi:UDP-N-acetylmuramyl pentapeptide synthase
MYEEKLTQQEDEHESEIAELKANHPKEIEKLNDIIGTLKNDAEGMRR